MSDSDGQDLRAPGDALRAVAASDVKLADRVADARANGRTWTQIATVLGVRKQAARERFVESRTSLATSNIRRSGARLR